MVLGPTSAVAPQSTNLIEDDCGQMGLGSGARLSMGWQMGAQDDVGLTARASCTVFSSGFTFVFLRRLVPCPCLDTCSMHLIPSRSQRLHFRSSA